MSSMCALPLSEDPEISRVAASATDLESVRVASLQADLDGRPVALVDVGEGGDVEERLVVLNAVHSPER